MTAIYGGADISACHCLPNTDASNPTHASTTMQGGQAVFENDNYRITMGDNNEVNICNKHTGEDYKVWGDPHVQVDGQQAFDFWGTTTFKLEDGTKVTIDTTPAAGNPNVTLASKVTITNGGYGAQISGIDTNKRGDLRIDEAKGWGHTLDAVVNDGNVLQENPAGKGFLGIDCHGQIRKVDQNYINETDLKKGGAHPAQPQPQAQPGSQPSPTPASGAGADADALAGRFREAFRMLSSLLSISLAGSFLGQQQGPREGGEGCTHGSHGHHHAHHPQRHAGFELTMARVTIH